MILNLLKNFTKNKYMLDLDRAIEFKENLHSLIWLSSDDDVFNNDKFTQERNYFVWKYLVQAPKFLKNCRTIWDFISLLKTVASWTGSWQARREFIDETFIDFLNFLEFWKKANFNQAFISDNQINIVIQNDVFSHVQQLLSNKHYFNAVEESYKIVRARLREITWEEQAHKAFSENNYLLIFKHQANNEAERDFFEWVKFLHMAIQKLRNEKAHTPANEIDKNLAIHYIVLASLAYDLISR